MAIRPRDLQTSPDSFVEVDPFQNKLFPSQTKEVRTLSLPLWTSSLPTLPDLLDDVAGAIKYDYFVIGKIDNWQHFPVFQSSPDGGDPS